MQPTRATDLAVLSRGDDADNKIGRVVTQRPNHKSEFDRFRTRADNDVATQGWRSDRHGSPPCLKFPHAAGAAMDDSTSEKQNTSYEVEAWRSAIGLGYIEKLVNTRQFSSSSSALME